MPRYLNPNLGTLPSSNTPANTINNSGVFACVPPGAICCSDGFTYVMPPRTCPGGTDPVATAVTSIEATTTPPPTPPPASTVVNVDYIWYTYTFTWYYWYYYYIYIDITSTRLVSTQYTSVSAISYSATDEAAASSYFTGYTATAVLPTPTQTATPVSGSVPPTYPTATSSISSVVVPSYSSNATATTAAPSPSSVVTAGGSKTAGHVGGWMVSPVLGAAALGLLSGVAMMVL